VRPVLLGDINHPHTCVINSMHIPNMITLPDTKTSLCISAFDIRMSKKKLAHLEKAVMWYIIFLGVRISVVLVLLHMWQVFKLLL
jgi:hypothetical protein